MNERTRPFQRNERLEDLLQELNSLLAPAGAEYVKQHRMPNYPVVFIIGLPRAGTTLLLQWLAQTGQFAYPTNLMARFYTAPAIGAMIQEMLTEAAYDFNNEFFDIGKNLDYQSNLGKTRGTLAPSEFWYFWRRFLPSKELSHFSPAALAQVEGEAFARELAAIEAVFDKPLALKALILQLNLSFLDKLVEKVVFLHIRRHPYFNAQSLLEAREKYYGQRKSWYSIKPPEYSWLKDKDPLTQVAGQVYFTDLAISRGLQDINPERYLTIDLESFCASPRDVFSQLGSKIAGQGYLMATSYQGPAHFAHTNQVRLSEADKNGILQAYRKFSGHKLIL